MQVVIVSHTMHSVPSQAVGGIYSGPKDDHRWGTLAALHPGVIRVVARGGISAFNGGRSRYRPTKPSSHPFILTCSYTLF